MMLMALMMSATSFAQGIKGTVIDENGDAYEVTVTIKNTGNHEGMEVVELYISAPGAAKAAIKQEKSDAGIGSSEREQARPEFIPVNKPVKELKAYAKTKLLKPGESETLKLTVKAADLASFDETASAWVVAEGEYQFLVAASAKDIKATLTANAKAQQTKANDVMKPQGQMNLLKR